MKQTSRWTSSVLAALVVGLLAGQSLRTRAQAPAAERGWLAVARDRQGRTISGVLEVDPDRVARLRDRYAPEVLPLDELQLLRFDNQPAAATTLPPVVQLRLGALTQISGRLPRIDAQNVGLTLASTAEAIQVPRAAVRSLTQITGEILELAEGFESAELKGWTGVATAERTTAQAIEGESGLRITPGKALELETRPGQAMAAGRVELAYLDPGTRREDTTWAIELEFMGPDGTHALRVLPGWNTATIGVLTSGDGPDLAVQLLERGPGWHRLEAVFEPESVRISVDDRELAFAASGPGPLTALRLVAGGGSLETDPAASAIVDDLRLVRFDEPATPREIDLSQDEIHYVVGDQVFGTIEASDAGRVRARVFGRLIERPWSQVRGVYFQRQAIAPSLPLAGLWVQAHWQEPATRGRRQPDIAEGVLVGLDEQSIELDVPLVGRLRIARESLKQLEILGHAQRIVLDTAPHHLGNDLTANIEPCQPEGGRLEFTFELAEMPAGDASVLVDVVHAVGIEGDTYFSDLVRQGELVTNLWINGQLCDMINRQITSRNDTPQRLRVPVPAGLLRQGQNVLVFDQVGTHDDPRKFDNLGVLEVAIEFATVRPSKEPRP